jgi:RNA polymerase sigma-70 factor (ECF subfamily)
MSVVDDEPPSSEDRRELDADAAAHADRSRAVDTAARAAATAGDWHKVATIALETYGDELLGFLTAQAKDDVAAADAFSMFAEAMWRGLPGFRWECSLRTWCYTLARHSWFRLLRDRTRGAELVPLMSSGSIPLDELAARIKSDQLSPSTRARLQLERLRDELPADDQILLTLRLDRAMAWRDVARVMAEPDDAAELDPATLERRAVTLRKRFMKIKDDLRARLEAARAES